MIYRKQKKCLHEIYLEEFLNTFLFLRSIVDKPNILILDEPCSNLDNHRKKKIENFLKKNKRKCKIILITHDLFQAQRLADEIIFIENGKILIRSPKIEFEKKK